MPEEVKETKETCHHGNEMTEEELKEYYEAFQLVEDSINELEDEEED